MALKSFLVGPNVAPPSLSLRRPGSSMPRKLPDGSTDPNPKCVRTCARARALPSAQHNRDVPHESPSLPRLTKPTHRFLSPKGRWVQEEMPALIAESQSQPLTATSTLTATLPGE